MTMRLDNMLRTQISLDPADYAAAKEQAAAEGISLAEFVRRAIRDKLPVDTGRPWMQYVGMVESGDSDSSHSIDEIVYGAKE